MMQKEPYILVEDWMLQEVGAGTSVLVYALLHSLAAASDDGTATASIRYMMDRLHATERMVDYALDELKERGLVQVVTVGSGRGHASRWLVKRVQKCTPIIKKIKIITTTRMRVCWMLLMLFLLFLKMRASAMRSIRI